jgi:RNA polymerase sigma-70 factor (ECF subfamily)
VVLEAGKSISPARQEALEDLCRAYWTPLYAFLRRKGHSPQDAEDLVVTRNALVGTAFEIV